eukprot:4413085-Amphidinium_carterae.1
MVFLLVITFDLSMRGTLQVQEQLTRIRAVTTPTIKQVESVQAVIEEGRIAEKASSFFDRHARTDLEAWLVQKLPNRNGATHR